MISVKCKVELAPVVERAASLEGKNPLRRHSTQSVALRFDLDIGEPLGLFLGKQHRSDSMRVLGFPGSQHLLRLLSTEEDPASILGWISPKPECSTTRFLNSDLSEVLFDRR